MIRTTNFLIHSNKIDLSKLKNEHILVRYLIPDTFRNYTYQDSKAYAKFENYYKEILERPCYRFKYDKGGETIYILHDKEDNIKPITFKLNTPKDELFEFQLEPSKVDFDDESLKTHVLMKILLADFFYKENIPHRICQHYFYLFGRNEMNSKGESTGFARGVHLRLVEQKKSNFLEYSIIPKATNFSRTKGNIKDIQTKLNPYFEVVTKSNSQYLRQIKPSKVLSFQQQNSKEIWRLSKTSMNNKAHLDWHTDNPDLQRSTKGYVIHQFQNRFISYLNSILGKDVAEPKYIDAKSIKSKIKTSSISGVSDTGLPLFLLKEIYVYDNRLKKAGKNLNNIELQDYIDLLNSEIQTATNRKGKGGKLNIRFSIIHSTDEFAPDKAILVLQDVAGPEFQEEKKNRSGEITQEEGFLSQLGFDDPKKELYDVYVETIPMQSINVNTMELKNRIDNPLFNIDNYKDYFNYDLFVFEESRVIKSGQKAGELQIKKTKFYHKLKVCLNELLLKYYIINQLPIHEVSEKSYPLPCIVKYPNLLKSAFQFKGVFLYINSSGELVFTDLATKKGKLVRNEILEKYAIIWNEIAEGFYKKKWLFNKGEDEKNDKINKAKFIFFPNTAIEILEGQERVLLEYKPDKEIKIRAGKRGTEKTDYGINGIWYHRKTSSYIIGRPSGNTYKFGEMSKAHLVRKFYCHKGKVDAYVEEILETMAVQFVRNKQFTIYPYFFDLINLYKDMKM